jgi:hypothetical protein
MMIVAIIFHQFVLNRVDMPFGSFVISASGTKLKFDGGVF